MTGNSDSNYSSNEQLALCFFGFILYFQVLPVKVEDRSDRTEDMLYGKNTHPSSGFSKDIPSGIARVGVRLDNTLVENMKYWNRNLVSMRTIVQLNISRHRLENMLHQIFIDNHLFGEPISQDTPKMALDFGRSKKHSFVLWNHRNR